MDASHIDRAGAQEPLPPDLKIIDNPGKIHDLLEKILIGEENVEVQLTQRTRVFFSQLLDHPPELIETTDGAGTIIQKEPFYRPYSYLNAQDHLIIAPLEPAIGNALIRTSSGGVTIRVFQGVNAIEGEVQFQSVGMVRGQPVIQLSYPLYCRMYRKRRHFRADITMGMSVTVKVVRPGVALIANVQDLSASGISFAIKPEEADKLPVGSQVTFLLFLGRDEKEIPLTGFIRNQTELTTSRNRSRERRLICGAQFDLINQQTAMRIDEMVAGIQREKIKRVMDKYQASRPELFQEEKTDTHTNSEQKRASFQKDLFRFFGKH